MYIPYTFAKQHQILHSNNYLYITQNTNLQSLGEVNRSGIICLVKIIPCLEFEQKLSTYYGQGDVNNISTEFNDNIDLLALVADTPVSADLLEQENDAPLIKLINTLITQAVREKASDIHIEAFETKSIARFRIDGLLRDIVTLPSTLHISIISRLKIMSNLDIAEKRLPQDGRISLKIAGKNIDVRLSTLPTTYGERVVMRLLEREISHLNLEYLGMEDNIRHKFENLLKLPHGIILLTGPTGSGKTTSLYAGLRTIDANIINIMTVEDPIEYELPNINQTQVNSKIDLNFAKVLRSILRQDPDVVMIGEIRDVETAQIAIQAALTGHLVLATLHTNTAVSAITRLIDMGIEPFLLSSTLAGVLSQRLVRKLCNACKKFENNMWQTVGCKQCNNTGYLGRTGIHELLVIDDNIKSSIHNNISELEIQKYAKNQGMKLIYEDAQRLLSAGITCMTEITRVSKEL